MGQPAATQGDQIAAIDTHMVMVPTPTGAPVPTPLPHPFSGIINGALSNNTKIMGQPAAMVGSTADNTLPYLPTPPGTSFQKPATNKATIQIERQTVMINDKPAARNGGDALTCNDLNDLPVGKVIAVGSVMIG